MNTLKNLIWFLFGGFIIALGYFIGGIVLFITIIGIPFGIQTFKIGGLAIWPFGRKECFKVGQPGCLSTFMNIIWILFGGIWISVSHLVLGVLLCITIIGIPFGKQHFKLMSLALTPFGKEIRYKD